MSASRFKLLTFREALQSLNDKEKLDTSLYVLNTTPRGYAGRINLTVTTSNGQKIAVQIPRLPGPIDLSTQATKADVMSCPDFRRIFERGLLKIVDSESAEDFYQTPEGQKLHKKIYDAVGEGEYGALDDGISTIAEPDSQDMVGETELAPQGVGPFIQNIVHRAGESDVNADDLITELESQLDLLADVELDFLIQRSPSAELKEWAATAKAIREE